MKKYLVLKKPDPENVNDLKIHVVEIDNISEHHFEGGTGSARTFFTYGRYYWEAFDTAKDAEAFREPAAMAYLKNLEDNAMRQARNATAILEAHK